MTFLVKHDSLAEKFLTAIRGCGPKARNLVSLYLNFHNL